MSTSELEQRAEIRVENVGGIDETEVAFSPGVTILSGRNATNRTSLLQAVMAACGSDRVSIKGDADEASVELSLDGETYTRTLRDSGAGMVTEGEPYLDDPTLADLFAFLLESNEARRAVERGDDLRDLIMRPVDTDEIRTEIERLTEQRRELEEELEAIEERKRRLPSLEEEQTRLESEIEEKRAELADVEAELEEVDADVDETREDKAELDGKLEELRERRSDLEDVRYDLETERESIETLREERSDLEDDLDDLSETPMGEVEELESRIDRLRERKSSIQSEVNELRSIITFNEDRLEDSEELLDEDGGEAVTDQLLAEGEVTCWTCGSEVERDQIRSTVDQLRERSQEKLDEMGDIEDELDELKERQSELREQQDRRERIERRLADIEEEIERDEDRIERLQERRESLTEDIEDLEAEVEDLREESFSEVLDLHKEANQLEFEIGRLESDRDDVTEEIVEVEDRIDERDRIEAEREELEDELADLRTRIEDIEKGAIEAFNEHMESVLSILDYANLDRIWLERVEREVREGRQKVTKSVFELHVIRSTDSGATYEDTVDHLSESEREVTGLVFALAGYLVHDVHETVPFMLLDSLEAIDSERIAALVEYLEDVSDYLVVALLPEDAAALPEAYERVGEI